MQVVTILIAFLFIAAFGGLFALSRTLDDPIGRELDQMRGRSELRALLTPMFGAADDS
jgi:hypothetical protein